MAHTKAAGTAKRTVDVAGKRLGIKAYANEFVTSGSIIVRQHGTHFHPGLNTMLGRDHTIFASKDGYVAFRNMTGFKRGYKLVDVLPQRKGEAVVTKSAAKTESDDSSFVATAEKEVVAEKPAKKATAKKSVKK